MAKNGQYQRCVSAIHWLETSGALALGAMFMTAVICESGAQAQTYMYTVRHKFTGGADGGGPMGSLIRDSTGLYGTTFDGGLFGSGVVFKLDKSGETVLYTFTGGADGGGPRAAVIRDSAGNLYGTTSLGGASGYGVVFKLDTTGTETVLYSFTGGADGAAPYAGLIRDAAGNLYGTTSLGGINSSACLYGSCGVVFKIDTTGKETVLHSFTGADGWYPLAGVVRDSAGNLYGTTWYGGIIGGACSSGGCGVVFKLDTTGKETVLYSFTGGADGALPAAGLILDSAGNLYGTAQAGGGCYPCGVVFKLDTTDKETVLYTFTGGADGGQPLASLIRDSAGSLYGTTYFGGASGLGVVYKLDPNGTETALHSFTAGSGTYPYGGLIRDSAGNLYGTTFYGGIHPNHSHGVVFKLKP